MDPHWLAAQALPSLSFVAFDTEATGYSNVTDRLIEIAGVRFRRLPGTWTVESEFSELIDPGRPIPAETVAIHGISEALLLEAGPDVAALDRFFAFVAESVLLVHYAPSDVGLISFAYVRAGRTPPRAFVLDTFAIARKLLPGMPNYSLETLARELGLPSPRHRALPDAHATRALFERCAERLGDPDSLPLGALLEQGSPLVTPEEFSVIPLELPEHLRVIEEAIASGCDLTIEYRKGSKGRAPRRVTPSHFFAREGHVFLEGYCHLDRDAKSFRLDRIERASRIENVPAAPASGEARG